MTAGRGKPRKGVGKSSVVKNLEVEFGGWRSDGDEEAGGWPGGWRVVLVWEQQISKSTFHVATKAEVGRLPDHGHGRHEGHSQPVVALFLTAPHI